MSEFATSELMQLPVPERLHLVEDLWNSIADAPESLELTDMDKLLIDERLAAREKDLAAGSPRPEVFAGITSKQK